MDQLSSTPPFEDQPFIMDGSFDVLFDDWPEADWAPSRLSFEAPSQEIRAPGNEQRWNTSSALQQIAPFNFDFANTHQSINDNLTTVDPAHQEFDFGALPLPSIDGNGTSLSAPRHSRMEAASTIPSEGNLLLLSDSNIPNQDGYRGLHLFGDLEYLKSLPHSVLKELSKNVAQVLAATEKAREESIESKGKTSLPKHRRKAARNTESKPDAISNVFKCQHPRCTTTFRHNKDRLRHFRNMHASNTKTYPCPVIDCPSGSGHQFNRSDKLRDHLRAAKILSLTHWSCIIPGCSEIPGDRADLMDHLGQHDHNTRNNNQQMLEDYGFASRNLTDYLLGEYICSIPRCPFGTDDKSALDAHLLFPHDGPYCPCPIPSCQEVSQDQVSASTHLAREHDHDTRFRFSKEIESQSLRYSDYIFTCPICHDDLKGYYLSTRMLHCQKHDHQSLLRFSEALVKAINFSTGPIIFGKDLVITGDMIVPYIILPYEERKKLKSKADFEEAVARIREGIELEKNS